LEAEAHISPEWDHHAPTQGKNERLTIVKTLVMLKCNSVFNSANRQTENKRIV